MPSTRPLDAIEIRVLGALMEKQQATPDYYPLTISAVIAACNQKSNRDPVTRLTETEVVEALDRLRLDVLTWRSDGARAERWEHRLDRRWELTAPKKAIMTLLLLRGPQTAGEIKNRSGRLHQFESLAEVENGLEEMSAGFDALVRELPRAPGQREIRWTYLVGTEEVQAELEVEKAPASTPARAPATANVLPPDVVERVEKLETRVGELADEVRELRERLGDF